MALSLLNAAFLDKGDLHAQHVQLVRTPLIAATLALGLLARRGPVRASGFNASIVIEWNQILQDTVPAPHNPHASLLSMTHIAMFDAINAIERQFECIGSASVLVWRIA